MKITKYVSDISEEVVDPKEFYVIRKSHLSDDGSYISDTDNDDKCIILTKEEGLHVINCIKEYTL